jgi:DNA-binding CsgD family transcriptional regulator
VFETRKRELDLTARQHEVLVLHARGLTAAEICAYLSISPRTARMHLDVLRQKLGVPRVRQLPAAYRWHTGRDPLGEALGEALGEELH